MNENLKNKLRQKVRKIVESIVNEEGPMEKPDNFKAMPVRQKRTEIIGNIKVDIADSVFLSDKNKKNQMLIDKKDALKLAEYLITVLGKV